jgi:alanine racemase
VSRWAWAEVDLDAIGHNVRVIRRLVGRSGVWAVVKADGYGHCAVPVARAALEAGAGGLCVALADEGIALRTAGIDAPVLVLSEQPLDAIGDMLEQRLTPTVYSERGIEALGEHAGRRRGAGRGTPIGVHLKVDTGMQRVGAVPGDVDRLVAAITRHDGLRLDGVMTHLAVADEPDDPMTDEQLDRFDEVLRRCPPVPFVHAANSAAGLAHPRSRRSFVRAGIAIYGITPGPGVAHLCRELRPAMSLHARISFVKPVAAGSRISYGLRHRFDRDTRVATVPIGYADGVPRRLSRCGGEVLVGGRRRPIVGVVTMDQLMVDVGDDAVAIGDEVVLLGTQGDQQITAEEWAERLDTVGYEVVCGVSSRVTRLVGPSIDR